MAKAVKLSKNPLLEHLHSNYLLRGLTDDLLADCLPLADLRVEKLFSNRPIYTAFLPDEFLDVLYLIVGGGLVITRSVPLDRITAIAYPGSCFGMRSLPFSYGLGSRAFPCLVEAYKTIEAIKIPLTAIEKIYQESEVFRERYRLLFELDRKFEYHLLNCSSYPPQAVAALLRALIYQERELGNQVDAKGVYVFDLPIDVIARACQLNQRTVEQVLKGMQQEGFLKTEEEKIKVFDPEGLKEVYSATRDKVSWWPLR